MLSMSSLLEDDVFGPNTAPVVRPSLPSKAFTIQGPRKLDSGTEDWDSDDEVYYPTGTSPIANLYKAFQKARITSPPTHRHKTKSSHSPLYHLENRVTLYKPVNPTSAFLNAVAFLHLAETNTKLNANYMAMTAVLNYAQSHLDHLAKLIGTFDIEHAVTQSQAAAGSSPSDWWLRPTRRESRSQITELERQSKAFVVEQLRHIEIFRKELKRMTRQRKNALIVKAILHKRSAGGADQLSEFEKWFFARWMNRLVDDGVVAMRSQR